MFSLEERNDLPVDLRAQLSTNYESISPDHYESASP